MKTSATLRRFIKKTRLKWRNQNNINEFVTVYTYLELPPKVTDLLLDWVLNKTTSLAAVLDLETIFDTEISRILLLPII